MNAKNNTKRHLRSLALGFAAALAGLDLPAQTTVPATHVLPSSAADTSKPGFVWRISEVNDTEPNQLAWAEDQLAGLHGNNLADPAAAGIALAPASPPNPSTAPIAFEIAGVLNLDKAAGSHGNFVPDDQMPGLPGSGTLDSGTGNAAAEALTYLDLPAGTITMAVNSDDGFRVTIGGVSPLDRFGVNVGQFDAGRGAADTPFTIKITQAGLYAARLLWENGGGDANVEWFTISGTKRTLINDAGGIKAYRAVTGPLRAYAQRVVPAPGDANASPISGLHVQLVDGATPIDKATVSLQLDAADITASASIAKPANITSIDYTNSTPLLSGGHTAALIYTEGTAQVTNSWSFTVGKYVILDPAWRVTGVDTSKTGFVYNYFANSDAANKADTTARAEADVALQAVDGTGALLDNLADPSVVGAALAAAAPANPKNAPLHFEIPGVINLSKGGSADNNGNFKPDEQEPGVPATDLTTDGQAAEILTFLTLPAGIIQMGVNSDDGFSTASGPNPQDAFGRVQLGAFNAGRGATDTLFVFQVQQAGTYPFRTLWENGGGDSNIEWFTIKPDGTKVLVNDVANGGVPAYRAATTAAPPYVKAATPPPVARQIEKSSRNVTVLLADGSNPVDDNSVTLQIDGKAATLAKTRQGNFLTIDSGVLEGLQLSGESHSAVLTFKDSTGTYSRTQQWTFYNLQNLILPSSPVAGENFDSYPESTSAANTVPPGWVATNFTFPQTPGWDLTDQTSDAFLNWVILSTDSVGSLEGPALQNDTSQIINGQPITNWASGNVIWAASDGRLGGGIPQVQIAVTKPFDLSTVTNPVLTFYSMLRISGNNTEGDAVEYSIDGGTNWLPVIYFQRTTLVLNTDGTFDAVACFNAPIATTWIDPVLGVRGGKLGDAILAPISQALAPYIAERGDTANSRKVEAIRLPQASKQKDVRVRFVHVGSCGWWWGLDNVAFYDLAPSGSVTAPVFHPPTLSGSSVTISWTGTGTLEETTALGGTWSTSPNQNTPQSVTATGNKFYRLKQ